MNSLNPINWGKLPEEILNSIEAAKAEYGWDSIGIRIQEDIPFTVGPINHVSRVWIDGEETEEELPGICTISATCIYILCKAATGYIGDHVAIIAGDVVQYGEDLGEVIMSDAEVVEVLV